MPSDPLFPEKRSHSPENEGTETRKRRRKVLSCYDCRRRKLQCDRVQPACGRCVKAGQASNCLYIEDSAEIPDRGQASPSQNGRLNSLYGNTVSSSSNVTPRGGTLSRLEYQDDRIRQLEAALAHSAAGRNAVQHSHAAAQPLTTSSVEVAAPNQEREVPLLRGRDFKTQFHGNTHAGSQMGKNPELANFSHETLELFPSLIKVREDMNVLENRVEYAGSKYGSVSDAELKAFLPARPETDKLMKIYFQNYGDIYQVLHLPTFWREYETLWPNATDANAHFVGIVLCLLASAQCLTSAQPWLYAARSSVAREKATAMVHAVENWLVSQSQKHVTAADFQVRFLLLFTKQACARKTKRTWSETGEFLRFCMSAGLHRTPDVVRKETSLLHKELRKRLWAAISELELQASFDRGMLSAPWILQSDCPPPAHIHDDDLTPSTKEAPPIRPLNQFNSVSFLHASAESIMLRTTINTNLNSIRQSMTFSDIQRYTDEIEAHLKTLPSWKDDDALVPRAMLTLNLRQYLLVLHGQHLRHTSSRSEINYCRMVAVETAMKIVDTHRSLTSRDCFALEVLRTDQLRAALTVCNIASMADPESDRMLTTFVDQASSRIVPDVVEMVTDKVYRFGCEQRQLWIILASNAFVKTKRDPDGKLQYVQEAVDKVTRTYYRIMACQDESAVTPSQPLVEDRPQLQITRNGSLGNTPSTSERYGEAELLPVGFNFDELAAWTFDDFTFNPDGFIQQPQYMPPGQLYTAGPSFGNGGF